MTHQNGNDPEPELRTSAEIKELEAILPDVSAETLERVLLWAARQVILGKVQEARQFVDYVQAGGVEHMKDVELYLITRMALLATELDALKEQK